MGETGKSETRTWAYLAQAIKDVRKDLIFVLAFSNDPVTVVSKVNSMLYYVKAAEEQAITEELAQNMEREHKFAEIRNRGVKPYIPVTAEGRAALGLPEIYLAGPSAETLAKELGHDEELPENRLKKYSKDLLSGLG